MHTCFSGDSKANPTDMIGAAKSLGLSGLTFTDHLDLDYPEEPNIFLLDIDTYLRELGTIATVNSADDFKVRVGIELGLQPHLCNELTNVVAKYDFDVVIGSTHVVKKQDPYYDNFWEGRSFEEATRGYYEEILKNITGFDKFDTLAHLDYAFRYRNPVPGMDTYSKYWDIIDAILEYIIKKDIALEINTGGCYKELNQTNPAPAIIKRYVSLGGKMVTVGADAHKSEYVGSHFNELTALIEHCGLKEFTYFEKRKPIMRSIYD